MVLPITKRSILRRMMLLEKLRTPLLITISVVLVAILVAIPFPFVTPSCYGLSALLLLLLAVAVAVYHRGEGAKAAAVFAAIGIMGWIVDVFAVKTGVVFGEYAYGPSLGVRLLDVPVIMTVYWAFVAYLGYSVAAPIDNPTRRAVAAAGSMVLFDIIFEPAAGRLGLWQFHDNHVPMQNYIFWFVFGYLFMLLIRKSRISFGNSLATPLYWMLVVFCLVLDFVLFIFKS